MVIAGRESIDYNGGMVPGMIAGLNNANFINNCISLEIDGANVTASREIDGGKETIESCTPLVIGAQKGLVEAIEFEKPKPKGEVTLVSSDNLDELINLLHNEAKVI